MYNKIFIKYIQSESFDGFMFAVLKSKVSKTEMKLFFSM